MRSGVTATHPKRKTAGVGVPVPVQDVAHHANHNLLVELLSISAVISPKPEWVVGIRRGRGSSVPKLVMLPVMANISLGYSSRPLADTNKPGN